MHRLTWVICLLAMKPTEQVNGLKVTFAFPGETEKEHLFKDVAEINKETDTDVYIATLSTDNNDSTHDASTDAGGRNVIFKTANSERGNELQLNELAVISFLKENGYSPLPTILFSTVDKTDFFKKGTDKWILGMEKLGKNFLDFFLDLKEGIYGENVQPEISKMSPSKVPEQHGTIVPGGVPYPMLVPYIIQLLGSLDKLQKLNVVHRDVKTENLLLSSNSSRTVVLTDFAFAKCKTLPDQTESNGTPQYLRMIILEELIASHEARSRNKSQRSDEDAVPKKQFIAIPEDDATGAAWSIAEWTFGCLPWLRRYKRQSRLEARVLLRMQREYIEAMGKFAEQWKGTPCATLAQILFDLLTRAQSKDLDVPSNWDFPYAQFIERFANVPVK